jgi:thioredoxin-like negative regulator of GroEL
LRARLVPELNRILDQELEGKRQGGVSRSAEIKSGPLYEPERFGHVQISEYLRDFIAQDPQGDTRVRLNRLLLEAAYPREIAKSPSAVYPDREIYTPSQEDSARCFNQYMVDAQRRLQLNQLKPGEDVKYDPGSGKMEIAGQVAVMSINALLTKVIFDHNPKNEFYVEESFPMDWMYPYLTPYGIIMKINRQPLSELREEIVKTDHEFWSRYAERLIGNWITYDTKIKDITDWVEKVYLRRNFSGFTGDRRFIRDDQAQKAFSKLRDSIGGLYAWRLGTTKPGTPEYKRMLREADFAFRQAFAFCPDSPEALFRYATLLTSPEVQRFDDALLIARTCQKLDPFNSSISDLVTRLELWKKQRGEFNPASQEKNLERNPDDFQAAFNLASSYLQLGQGDRALEVLERVLKNPHATPPVFHALLQAFGTLNSTSQIQATVDRLAAQFHANPPDLPAGAVLAEGYHALQKPELALQTLDQVANATNLDASTAFEVAQQFAAMADYPRLEAILQRLVKLAPESPEAWFDLAAMKTILGKPAEAFPALRQSLKLSAARLTKNPKAKNLLTELQTDPRFNSLRRSPEFQELTRESAPK